MKEILKVTNLSKTKHLPDKRGRPQPRKVLDDITLTVYRGEVYVILGPTGSGKTTLLRMLNRLEVPDSGSVLLDGRNAEAWDVLDLRRKVGLVFQTPALFEGTVEENILYAVRLKGETGHSLAENLAAQAGLSRDILHRSTRELSTGEKQKVAIARALANQPEVLLMDEPSSAQDPTSKAGFEDFVRRATGTGLTVVMVTHDVEQARRLAHRVLLIVDGSKVAEEEADQLFGENAPEMVRRFLEGNMEVAKE